MTTPKDQRDEIDDEGRVECRKCGCRHFMVQYTRPRPRGIMRKRICRHCGTAMITWERPR